MSDLLSCPFCKEDDFDVIGLKRHLLRGWCKIFENTDSVPAYTTGHCPEKAKPGGCQLHNLQCGWPKCDRREVAPNTSHTEVKP